MRVPMFHLDRSVIGQRCNVSEKGGSFAEFHASKRRVVILRPSRLSDGTTTVTRKVRRYFHQMLAVGSSSQLLCSESCCVKVAQPLGLDFARWRWRFAMPVFQPPSTGEMHVGPEKVGRLCLGWRCVVRHGRLRKPSEHSQSSVSQSGRTARTSEVSLAAWRAEVCHQRLSRPVRSWGKVQIARVQVVIWETGGHSGETTRRKGGQLLVKEGEEVGRRSTRDPRQRAQRGRKTRLVLGVEVGGRERSVRQIGVLAQTPRS